MKWTIHAYDAEDSGELQGVVIVVVEAQHEEEAMIRAKKLVEKTGYRVMKIDATL